MLGYQTSPQRVEYDTRSIFKRNKVNLNLEFPLPETEYPTKTKEPCLPNYLPVVGGRTAGFLPFPKGISTKWNAEKSIVQDLNSRHRFHILLRWTLRLVRLHFRETIALIVNPERQIWNECSDLPLGIRDYSSVFKINIDQMIFSQGCWTEFFLNQS